MGVLRSFVVVVAGIVVAGFISCCTAGFEPTLESQQAIFGSGSGGSGGPDARSGGSDASSGSDAGACTSQISSCGPTMRYKCCHSGDRGEPVCEERTSNTAPDLGDCQWVDDPWCLDSGDPYRPYELQY